MGLCDKRHFLLTICVLQIITTTERQVFDFLGYMWVPILFNFFNIIFVILGFFGAFQYRAKYIISYCVWNVLWLTWNAFLICFYLEVGGLDKNSDLLNFGTGSFSWWLINGPGCKEHSNSTVPDPDVYRPIRPDHVTGCLLEYEIIEVIHSSVQCFLSFLSIIGGICLSRVFLEEDDSFDFVGGGDFGTAGHTPLHPMYVSYSALPAAYGNNKQASTTASGTMSDSYYYPTNTTTTAGSANSTLNSPLASSTNDPPQIRKKKKKQLRPLYSIEYSRPEPPIIHHQHHQDDNVSPKPMTPRRVKRRSVISRDGTHRRSNQRLRSSTASRQSARRKNPINRIMDQQESLYANTSAVIGGLINQNVNSLSHGTLNYDRISGHWDRERNASHPNIPGWQIDTMTMSASSPNIWKHDSPTYPVPQQIMDPGNWESVSSTRNLAESCHGMSVGNIVNPAAGTGDQMLPPNMMQWQGQSNPTFQQTSMQSLNGEELDDQYGNRPASARSSYSNYHGVRATPQVPSRSDNVRQSQRQFVLNGPPAYQDTVI